jgi:hypothetical protein
MIFMNKYKKRWLYKEIKDWLKYNLISEYQAESIYHYYEEKQKRVKRYIYKYFWLILVSFLGLSFLVTGLNTFWIKIPIYLKVLMAFGPLGIMGGFAWWFYAFQMEGVKSFWQFLGKEEENEEVRGLILGFTSFALLFAIGLISLTFNYFSLSYVLLAWSLINIIMLYLVQADLIAIIYYGAITAWNVCNMSRGSTYWYWILFMLALPYLNKILKKPAKTKAYLVLEGVIILGAGLSLGLNLKHGLKGMWSLVYIMYFYLLILVGGFYENKAPRLFRLMKQIGFVGLGIVVYMLNFKSVWWQMSMQKFTGGGMINKLYLIADVCLFGSLVLVLGLMLIKYFKHRTKMIKQQIKMLIPGVVMFLSVLSLGGMVYQHKVTFQPWLFAGLSLGLAGYALVKGIKNKNKGWIYGGAGLGLLVGVSHFGFLVKFI